jgi:hypothetical protein
MRKPPSALNDNAFRRAEHRFRPPGGRGPNPMLGMEGLDLLGIDIDQDPRAFAKFLELRNMA